jgi:hypothetical protein
LHLPIFHLFLPCSHLYLGCWWWWVQCSPFAPTLVCLVVCRARLGLKPWA